MKKDMSVRMSLFFDAGQIHLNGNQPDFESFRYSTGIAVSWSSPIGPLKFSFGQALNAKKNIELCDDARISCGTHSDKIERFQFQLGTVF
jgi:outer membrane protein insertion porin family